MTVQIRDSVFETNSSSTHSISVTGLSGLGIPSLSNDQEFYFGEYGWGYDVLGHWIDKLSYVATSIQYFDNIETEQDFLNSKWFIWLNGMFLDFTGFNLLPQFNDRGYCKMGFVDHQSSDLLSDYFIDNEDEFKSGIRDLIFGRNYEIVIDNDNN